jgi:hypothetical protein
MPRRNRVTPFGEIIATPERGTFLGNRGILHDSTGCLRRAWQVKRWLICALQFRGRHREVMTPNSYTELFFLDEATALAAGHRPCAECRYTRFISFCHAWKSAHPGDGARERPRADEIDRRLHAERITRDRSKHYHTAALDELPNGVLVTLRRMRDRAYLVWGEQLLEWSAGGYKHVRPRPKHDLVLVLTPKSTVGAIRAGYVPEIHASTVRLVPQNSGSAATRERRQSLLE